MNYYPRHKLNDYPELAAEAYERLKQDLSKNGYDEKFPIWLYEDAIIDGWNRQRACKELAIKPVYKEFKGSIYEALTFMIRTNNRRDLSSSQRAAIAVNDEIKYEIIKKQVAEEGRRKISNRDNVANQHTSTMVEPPELIPENKKRTPGRVSKNI